MVAVICYVIGPDSPPELIKRQTEMWDPVLEWAQGRLRVRFMVQTGVMPLSQRQETCAAIVERTSEFSPFELTGFHEFVTLTGSWILGYAICESHLGPGDSLAIVENR